MATETKAPAPIVKTSITVNGAALAFAQGVINRGDLKGIPAFTLAYKNDAKTPDIAELATIVAALGAPSLLTAFAKTLRNVCVDASVAAATKGADGKYTTDPGKFAEALTAEVNDLVAAQKDQLKEELNAIENKINDAFARFMTDYSAGKPIDQKLKNESMQLQVKRAEIMAKLQKKGRKEKAAESAATPTAAPAKA